jgi:hypothetical protein
MVLRRRKEMKVEHHHSGRYNWIFWAFGCFALLIFCTADSRAQALNTSQDSEVVMVQSWKRGDSKVSEQVLDASLKADQAQYEFDIFTAPDKDKHFRLRLRQSVESTVRTPGLPCWIADFREISKDEVSTGNQIGYNLLSAEGPGVGDNFPREEWAGYFCPIEKPNKVLDGLFYPMRAVRRFLIESFVLDLQVVDYDLAKQQKKLRNVQLRITFSNQ